MMWLHLLWIFVLLQILNGTWGPLSADARAERRRLRQVGREVALAARERRRERRARVRAWWQRRRRG